MLVPLLSKSQCSHFKDYWNSKQLEVICFPQSAYFLEIRDMDVVKIFDKYVFVYFASFIQTRHYYNGFIYKFWNKVLTKVKTLDSLIKIFHYFAKKKKIF